MATPQSSPQPSPTRLHPRHNRRTVITYGTFDTLHHGHIRLLRRARSLGDYLIVGLSTDEFNAAKGKRAVFPYHERKVDLEAISYVDAIVPETCWDQKAVDVAKYGVNVFTIGRDWEGKFDFLEKKGCEVVYLDRTPGVSSTDIRKLSEQSGQRTKWAALPGCGGLKRRRARAMKCKM